MINQPEISVVLPVYNGERYIKKAIESILGQHFKEIELIVVDDCSVDDTFSIVKGFEDPRIRLIKNPVNQGNYFCRNIGNKLSRGKYIAVMDADDIALRNRLDTQYRYLEANPSLGLVGSYGAYINAVGEAGSIIKKPVDHHLIRLFLFRDNCFVHSSMMYRKSLLKKHHIFYNEQFKYAADYDFAVRCSRKFKVMNIPEILIQYRAHKQQISQEKKTAQVAYADRVRLNQLRQFKIKLNTDDVELHLRMMQINLAFKEDMAIALDWCNRIIDANERLKIYHHRHLYDFLSLTVSESLQNNLH